MVSWIPHPGPTPWGSLRNSNRSCPFIEHCHGPRPVQNTCQALPISSCGWGHYDAILQVGRKTLAQGHSVAELGLKARAASLAAGGPRSLLAREPEISAQSEYRRKLSGALQPWQSPKLSLLITWPPPTQGPGNTGLPW